MSCKYCKLPAEDGDSLSPCECKGSLARVHPACLLAWLAVKEQEPLWQCEMCHGKIQYSFAPQSFYAGLAAFMQTFTPTSINALCATGCTCMGVGCGCTTLFGWTRRAIVVFPIPYALAYMLWVGFKVLCADTQVRYAECAEVMGFVFEVLIILNLLDVIANRQPIGWIFWPTAFLVVSGFMLAHVKLRLGVGYGYLVIMLTALPIRTALAASAAYSTACRRFVRARLAAEAHRFPNHCM